MISSAATPPRNEDSLRGFLFALSAYLLWGFMPLYMKALAHISPVEVIAHRILWSLPIATTVILWLGRTADLRAAFRSSRTLGMSAVAAALVSLNWGIYVWAIGAGHTLDAALGYYINPLFSVALGAVVLGERLGRLQIAAIALAACAVTTLAWEAGTVPWVSVSLTLTWGFYAYLKKSLPIGPNQGFTLEVLMLSPFALAYALWLSVHGEGHFLAGSATDTLLLLGCGAVTAIPLMLYANGAKLLKLSTIAVMQYVAPTMVFLTAVFLFGEPMDRARMIAFPMIWLALILYSAGLIAVARPRR